MVVLNFLGLEVVGLLPAELQKTADLVFLRCQRDGRAQATLRTRPVFDLLHYLPGSTPPRMEACLHTS
jgi:hypothetical protein